MLTNVRDERAADYATVSRFAELPHLGHLLVPEHATSLRSIPCPDTGKGTNNV